VGTYIFRLPDIGEGVAEAEIVAWHVKVGDHVEEDQVLVDVMTDKATVEMTSPVSGTVAARHGEVGSLLPVGSNLVEFATGEGGANDAPAAHKAPVPAARPAERPAPAPAQLAAPAPAQAQATALHTASPAAEATTLPLASPATRRFAHERGINLRLVAGSGPGGRVTREDVEAFITSGGNSGGALSPVRRPRTRVTETKLIGLRRAIAERMQEAKRRIPHFSYVEEFDMTELEGLRRTLNEGRAPGQPKLTLLPFFMRAVVRTLPDFPHVNARFDDEAGVLSASEGIHIGIATQTDRGLMVPVIRHAETLSLWESARELIRVTQAARDGSAPRDLLTGSTITLTSLGTLGGISATPVINRPEVAIIGPNKLVERPVVVGGQIVIRAMMNVSSSFDHRIVDGYDAARFIQALKRLMESPALLFVDTQ
jgi:2-oxoisovalerate dehydrogenase E2 component (dihydrolipoyl transacylase)